MTAGNTNEFYKEMWRNAGLDGPLTLGAPLLLDGIADADDDLQVAVRVPAIMDAPRAPSASGVYRAVVPRPAEVPDPGIVSVAPPINLVDALPSSSSSTDSSESASGTSSSSSVVVARAAGARLQKRRWFMVPSGGTVTVDEYKQQRRRKGHYKRLVFKCDHHAKCFKKRSVSLRNCRKFGAVEPLAFLCVWHDMACNNTAKGHNSKGPSELAINKFVADNPNLLGDVGIDVRMPV